MWTFSSRVFIWFLFFSLFFSSSSLCILLLMFLYHFLICSFLPFDFLFTLSSFHVGSSYSHTIKVFNWIEIFFSVWIRILWEDIYHITTFYFCLVLSLLFDIYGPAFFKNVAPLFFIKNKIHVLHLSRLFYDNKEHSRMLASVMIYADAKKRFESRKESSFYSICYIPSVKLYLPHQLYIWDLPRLGL